MTRGHDVSLVFAPQLWSEDMAARFLSNYADAMAGLRFELVAAFPKSDETAPAEFTVSGLGCRVVVSSGSSVAEVLNCGVAVADADLVLVLEEDMLLPPGAVKAAVAKMRASDDAAAAHLETRDSAEAHELGEAVAVVAASSSRYLESSPRATSNRGLALVCKRDAFLHVRGLDERSSAADHASQDLLARLSRAGFVVEWLNGPAVAAYHFSANICPSTGHGVEGDHKRKAHDEFIASDTSIFRNLTEWSVPPEERPVLVSVCISTKDRCEYLADSINSVLAQSFAEFELIIVDDGSTDDTEAVVKSFDDTRVRYIHKATGGISSARNVGADASIGHYTAVHDDDDIMLPWRLEAGLAALTEGVDATYGAWVNFDDVDARMVLHMTRAEFTQDLLVFNGMGPAHSTWMVSTALVRQLRYDETLSSAVDHNLASRIMWAGVRWVHVGRVLFLRRMHGGQVSAVDADRQKSGARLTKFSAGFTASWSGRRTMREHGAKTPHPPAIPERNDLFAAFSPYLPDHLVRRHAVVVNNVTNKVIAMDRSDGVEYMLAENDLFTGRLRMEVSEVADITWADLVRMRRLGVTGVSIEAEPRDAQGVSAVGAPGEGMAQSVDDAVWKRLHELMRDLNGRGKSPAWLLSPGRRLSPSEIAMLGKPDRAVRLSAGGDNGARVRISAVGYSYWEDAVAAMRRIPEAVSEGRIFYCDTVARSPEPIFREFRGTGSRS